jgi:hypothetical protein
MARHVPDSDRTLEGVAFREALDRLALRAVRESGGTKLRALADLRAAVEYCIVMEARRSRASVQKLTWREVGDELGVSAQAAQQRYGWQQLMPPPA